MASGGERPFVGRDEALREIARHLAAAEDGSGRVVLVLGEAGVGKTRLVERAIAELPAESVAWGRCHEGGAPAFWPWREALARLAGTLPAEALERARGAGAGEIARIVPAIAADGAPGTAGAPVVPDTVEARFRLFDAVASFLRAAAGSVPLAIVLDDLHWADRESFLLLRFLAPEIRRARVIVLATAREEEMREAAGVPHLLGDLVRIAERVPLAGLTPGDVRDYARAAAGRGVADAVVDAIHRATSGNAFFVTELVDLLDRSGLLDASRIDVERLALPVGVRDAVLRRLENLPPDARRALDVAAVAGREIDVAVLAHVLGVGPEAALACATPAFERRVLTDDGLAPGRVRFVHELVADALRAQLSPDALRATHLALADAFEARAVGAREEIEGEIARRRPRAPAARVRGGGRALRPRGRGGGGRGDRRARAARSPAPPRDRPPGGERRRRRARRRGRRGRARTRARRRPRDGARRRDRERSAIGNGAARSRRDRPPRAGRARGPRRRPDRAPARPPAARARALLRRPRPPPRDQRRSSPPRARGRRPDGARVGARRAPPRSLGARHGRGAPRARDRADRARRGARRVPDRDARTRLADRRPARARRRRCRRRRARALRGARRAPPAAAPPVARRDRAHVARAAARSARRGGALREPRARPLDARPAEQRPPVLRDPFLPDPRGAGAARRARRAAPCVRGELHGAGVAGGARVAARDPRPARRRAARDARH